MIEIVAMNESLVSLGAVRIVPDDELGERFSLELRHQVHAALLTQDWTLVYAELLPRLSNGLVDVLRPAIGGLLIESSSHQHGDHGFP